MEKKYQVFVSSTYVDLTEERKEVIQALLELDCIPVGMEMFPAADEDQWSLIKRLIEDCDYYVLILGGRYGSLNEDGISYTQMEYEYAKSQNIPTISFLHKSPEKIEVGKSELDKVKVEKLNEFKIQVQEKMCKYWQNSSDLGSQVSRSLVKLIKEKPRTGWIKANEISTEEFAREILELKRQNDILTKRVNENTNPPQGIEELSQGNEKIELKYSFKAYDESNPTWMSDFDTFTQQTEEFEISWNDIFKFISPFMIDEINEYGFRSKINDLCRTNNYQKEVARLDRTNLSDFKLDEVDFNKIKIQLRALGLITKSEKKRSIKDNGMYWQLTAYGDSVMTRLLAIQKQ